MLDNLKEFSLIYPMFAMVMLTFVVLIKLFRSRVKSVAEGKISGAYFKTYQGEVEPESTIKFSRHYANLFEAPTLFYIACLAAMLIGLSGLAFHILAWAYVMLRAAHAYIHTGRNKLRPRIAVYFASCIVLLLMWTYLVISVLTMP